MKPSKNALIALSISFLVVTSIGQEKTPNLVKPIDVSESRANDDFTALVMRWERSVLVEYRNKGIRRPTLVAEFETVRVMQATKDLITYGRAAGMTAVEFFDAVDSRVWLAPECEGFAPFVLCEIIGVDAQSVLDLTGGDEFKIDLILKSIFGIARYGKEDIRFDPAR